MNKLPESLNVLVAYPYMLLKENQKTLIDSEINYRLLLDSGAFTAHKSGKPISLDEYCRFLENPPVSVWRYFALDVIGNPEHTERNYLTMLSRGFNPIPVYTCGEDVSVIDDLYKTSDVIGIGGLNFMNNRKAYVNAIMRKINGRNVHWLGFTKFEMIKAHKPFSCDSTTYLNGPKYGILHMYLGKGQHVAIHRKKMNKLPSAEICEQIHKCGFDPYCFSKIESWFGTFSKSRYLSGTSAVYKSMDIERTIGTLYFNAAAFNPDLKILIDGFNHFSKRGYL